MTATIIDGKAYAEKLRASLKQGVEQVKNAGHNTPGLAVVLVGSDPASEIYVGSKGKMTREVGMNSFEHRLPDTISEAELLTLIDRLNNDNSVHGILVQLPLPKHINEKSVINRILPAKDVDGFHAINAGKLATGQKDGLVPCTPLGSVMLAKHYGGNLAGKHAVVVGRSNIVGKPVAQLLLQEDCTVTIAHSRTQDLPAMCRSADVLVAAVGRAQMIKGDWVKQGAIVIDVGINRLPPATEGAKGKIVGDVDFESAKEVAGFITPVPGGVGPMTIACLLYNTLKAFCEQENAAFPL